MSTCYETEFSFNELSSVHTCIIIGGTHYYWWTSCKPARVCTIPAYFCREVGLRFGLKGEVTIAVKLTFRTHVSRWVAALTWLIDICRLRWPFKTRWVVSSFVNRSKKRNGILLFYYFRLVTLCDCTRSISIHTVILHFTH